MKHDVTINIPDECVVPAIEDALGNKPTPAFENPVGILGEKVFYLRYAFPDGTLVFSDGRVLKVPPKAAAEIRKAWFSDATRSRRQQIDLFIDCYRAKAERAEARFEALRARPQPMRPHHPPHPRIRKPHRTAPGNRRREHPLRPLRRP